MCPFPLPAKKAFKKNHEVLKAMPIIADAGRYHDAE